jgi:hypothetical protein
LRRAEVEALGGELPDGRDKPGHDLGDMVRHDGETKSYLVGAAYCVSSLRMILPPFITNLTR